MNVRKEDGHAPLDASGEFFSENDPEDGQEREVPAAVLPPVAPALQDKQEFADNGTKDEVLHIDGNLDVPRQPEPDYPEIINDIKPDLTEEILESIIAAYTNLRMDIEIFSTGVRTYLTGHSDLKIDGKSIVHSSKERMKDTDHLRDKIRRKYAEGKIITPDNLFSKITDLAGLRILHLYQDDFRLIDTLIRKRIRQGEWVLFEEPVAHTWDPEATRFFADFDVKVEQRETRYTSVHYVVKPRNDSPICCEIQVRTLFEEIWGEVDHQINYPSKTESIALREQLLVLSKITGAGSRLLDSIRRVKDAEGK